MRSGVKSALRRAILSAAAFGFVLGPALALGQWEHPECTCRSPQGVFHIGEDTCINGVVATCEMTQNVTNWRMGGATCP